MRKVALLQYGDTDPDPFSDRSVQTRMGKLRRKPSKCLALSLNPAGQVGVINMAFLKGLKTVLTGVKAAQEM